jgi:hypothetical protein
MIMKTTKLQFSKSICCFFLICLMLDAAHAATKYVSNTGNNNNSGNSWAQAWLTLQYASTHIAAGDSVWIQDGTYVGFDMRIPGTAANPIVFIAAGPNVNITTHNPVTLDGINVEDADYIEINGVRVLNQPRNGIRLALANHCIVRNTFCDNNLKRGIFTGFTDDLLLEYNECSNSIDEHGIYVSNSSDRSIIRYNVCHHNHGGGIQINADASQGGDGISTDPEIYGNIIYENGTGGGAGINLDGVQGAFIYNNLLYQNHATGIALFQLDGAAPSIDADIVYNTIINASDARWCILAVNGSSGAQVYNNIIINQHPWKGSIALDPDAVPGFNSDYNILVNSLSNTGDGNHITLAQWQALGYDAHSMLAAPLASIFVNPAGGDYHLLSNSQAVNAGNATFSFGVNIDLEGITRPQGPLPDLGSYESTAPLSLDENQIEHHLPGDPLRGIMITSSSISWGDDLEGTLIVLSMDGKVVSRNAMESAGEFTFNTLIPGIYIAAVERHHYMMWARGFIVP